MIVRYFFELKRLIAVSVLSVFMSLVYTFSADALNNENTVSGIFENLVGYNDFYSTGFSNLKGVLLIFILALPMINYFEKNLSKANVYIFTRGKIKQKYFAERFAFLGIYCFISALLFLIFKLLFIEYIEIGINIVLCFLNFFLTLYVFSCAVCIVSIFVGSVSSYLLFVIIYCALTFSVTLCYYKYSYLFMVFFILLNPTARYMLSWNEGYSEMLNSRELELMSPWVSIAYNVILLVGWAVAMCILLGQFDLSLKQYDEE